MKIIVEQEGKASKVSVRVLGEVEQIFDQAMRRKQLMDEMIKLGLGYER